MSEQIAGLEKELNERISALVNADARCSYLRGKLEVLQQLNGEDGGPTLSVTSTNQEGGVTAAVVDGSEEADA